MTPETDVLARLKGEGMFVELQGNCFPNHALFAHRRLSTKPLFSLLEALARRALRSCADGHLPCYGAF